MKTITMVSIIILNLFNCNINAQNGGRELFDNSLLHQIKFESSTSSGQELWNSLTDSYTMVNITIDGTIVDSVGVRRKGFTSNASPQKPLKIDINRFIDAKKFDGLKKFNLHNNFKDDYLQRERLAYEIYRRAGLPSPRTSYAEVYFDDTFVGLYSVVEQIDKTFLKHNFPSNNGSLIKAEPPGFVPGIMLEVKEGTMDEFNQFRNNVNANNLGSYVNLRNYLKQLAVDIIIEDWDGYSFNRHNFYMYFETKSELLNLINYDHNYAFAIEDPNNFLYPLGTFPTITNMIDDPILKSMYEQTLCELLSYLLDSDFILAETSSNFSLLNTNNNGVKAKDPNSLVQYIANRKTWLQDTLTALQVNCPEISCPIETGDIVINEFVAFSDSANGMQEPNGGTPDWIELYNNTSNEINLGHNFYLSDDKYFPKKWSFPEEVTLPGNGYLIVWADNDIHQQGIHSGFKLEKDRGEILLTYENLETLENINYGQQSLNMAFARVPNGTGNLLIQQPTFNAKNSDPVGIDEEFESFGLIIYPNPTNDLIWVNSNKPIQKFQIFDVSGKQRMNIQNPVFPIKIDELQAGIYFVALESDSDKHFAKLIVR
jgi:hypothetical protein